jgi:hypothetical protein
MGVIVLLYEPERIMIFSARGECDFVSFCNIRVFEGKFPFTGIKSTKQTYKNFTDNYVLYQM